MGGRHRARRATHALAALALLAAGALLPATPAFANAAAPPDEAELWPRLAAQQSLAHIEHPRIALWERRWRAQAAQLRVIFEQGGHWLYPVIDAVEARGLPGELALIPVIESRLLTQAESHKSAVGLWQMRAPTATALGLRIDDWVDERCDPLKATTAALDYLQALHDRFGSWPLTLAAYNAGQGRVARAIRSARRGGRPEGYWDLDLPTESVDYVPRLLGLARALHHVEGLRLPWVDPQRAPIVLPTGGARDVETLAALSGASIAEIYAYNPQLRRWALPPGGPWRVLLPQRRANVAPTLRIEAGAGLPHWRRIEVQPGDSLGRLAAEHQTRVRLIQRANGLTGDRIRIGEPLWVPAGRLSVPDATLQAVASRGRVTGQPGALPGQEWITVAPGDSLWRLSREYGQSVAQLRRWNAMGRDEDLYPGQRLRVAPPPGRRLTLHRVAAEDSLPGVAERYGVSVGELRRWNRLGSGRLPLQRDLVVFAPE